MKKVTVIFTVRENVKAFIETLDSFVDNVENVHDIELLVAIDDDDTPMLLAKPDIEYKYREASIGFFICKRSEHFTKDYWNMLAKNATGRFILPAACDQKMLTKGWDRIIYDKMDERATMMKDDIVHGLIRDNIKRIGEDPQYPNFSCNPVLSKEHVQAMGYFFDERYWSWGSDVAVSMLYRNLFEISREWRIVSLVDVSIFTYNSPHVVPDTMPEEEIQKMKENDKGYQLHARIAAEHPCILDDNSKKGALYDIEAKKLKKYIKVKRRGK